MSTTVLATRMRLHPGQQAEYTRRHDTLWPEMFAQLRDIGITDYRIFLDPETRYLFAVVTTTDPAALADLPARKIVQDWWAHMADIMETNPDNSPVSVPLEPVFDMYGTRNG
ncbi:L-rhamnose mutarotase [Oceaniglobus trochenteri]|uniref:L-rhamnose mutarotase n=1 Tax=Oceaniglobus trochenteri TaxID=2763260 RepID=UPI001CFFA54B|nr:L-rhamnose mutarotase [Oceaniglobus trochenteri]